MKKTIHILMLTAGMIFAINIGNSQAQESKIHAGAQVAYGTNSGSGVGIGANGYYTINENIRAGLDFVYYLGSPENTTFWELNFNGQYHFDVDGAISPYGLAGINVSHYSFDIPNVNVGGVSIGGSSGASKIGLNVGGGVEYPVGFGALFAEAKYILSTYDQLVIGAGVRIGF